MLKDVKPEVPCSEVPGRFDWIDSVIVTAIRQGHWLLISRANFCRFDIMIYCVFDKCMYTMVI